MKIKVSIIGYGLSGRFFHAPLIKAHSDFEVVAICSTRHDEIKQDFPKAQITSFEEAVSLGDLVVIATPHQLHFSQTKYALEKDKHVVVEKPFTSTLEEAQKLFAIAEEKKRVLAVFHNRRFDADFLTIKKMMEEKSLGEIVTIESHFDRFRPVPKEGAWREQAGEQSEVWWDLGPHLIDQAKQLMGIPESVDFDIGRQREGVLADDYFNVTFKYAKGRRIHLRASCIVKDFGFRFRLHGTKGSAVFTQLDLQESQLRSGLAVTDANFGKYPKDAFQISSDCQTNLVSGRYISFYDEVLKSIKESCEFFITKEDVLFTTSLLLGKTTF